jgi:hypothetical protein
MSIRVITENTASVTLTSNDAIDLLNVGETSGIDTAGADVISIAIKNLDVSNAIGTITVYEINGELSAAKGSNYGSLAAGVTIFIHLTAVDFERLRVVATSASGASAKVSARGFRTSR